MPKAYCYLPQKTLDQLDKVKLDDGYDSSSHVMKDMIEIGLKVHLMNQGNVLSGDDKYRMEKEEELQKKHTTYLLRLLGLSADIFRCVYDENKIPKSKGNVEEDIAEIKNKVESFIDSYIND